MKIAVLSTAAALIASAAASPALVERQAEPPIGPFALKITSKSAE
jgi:hypothetical protein